MAGRVLRITSRTQHSFTKIQNNQSQTLLLARRVDVAAYKELVVVFRLHSGSFGAGMTANILVFADGYTDDDPGNVFIGGTNVNGTAFATSPNLQGLVAPGVLIFPVNQSAALAGGFGPLLTIALFCQQPAAAVAADIQFSVDLSVKE